MIYIILMVEAMGIEPASVSIESVIYYYPWIFDIFVSFLSNFTSLRDSLRSLV